MDRETTSILEHVVRSSVDGILAFDADCRYTLWNPAMERISGVAAAEVIGRRAFEVFPFLVETGEVANFLRVLRGETVKASDRPYSIPETGHEGHFEGYYSPLHDEAGAVIGGLAIIRDVTERRRAEQDRAELLREQVARREAERAGALLAQSEERYRAFVAQSTEGIWRFELEEPVPTDLPADEQIERFFRHAYLAECNDAMARMYGYERAEEIAGARLTDLLVPTEPANLEYLRSFVASGYRLRGAESHEVDSRGRTKYFENNLVGIVEGGRLTRAWGTQVDVTERVESDRERERLLESERRAREEVEVALGRHRDAEERMATLAEASGMLLGTPEVGAVLPAVLALSRRLVAADAYAVWRRAGDEWHVVTSSGLSDAFLTHTPGDQRREDPLLSGPIACEDALGEPSLAVRREAYLAEGIASLLVVPLRIHGEASGTLTFYYRSPHRFADTEVRVATALANLAGAAVGTAELYEEQRRMRAEAEDAEKRSKLLGEAGALLASSLDYQMTLSRLAALSVPGLADWCAVDVVGDDGEVSRLAVAHKEPEKVRWARELQRRYPPDPAAPYGVMHVLRTGRSEIYAEISDEMLVSTARDDEHLRIMREVGLTSAMIVPLATRGRALGAITFVSAESGYRYGPADLAFAEDLAGRAAVAVENARLYREAQEARARAEAANRLKDEFLATLSHELRTPLNAIVGWTRLMLSGSVDPEGARRALETIDRNARAQVQIVEDILDVSRIITGKLRLDVRPVDLAPVVEAAVDAARPAADAKGVRIATAAPAGAGPVAGDPDRLQQVVWNLLSNAVKFTPRGGTVSARLRRSDSHAEIEVSDTGAGIEPEFLPYVFDRFRQADSSTTRAHGGLGLGLAIVRQLVELHGGSVSVASPGPGGGATFTVRLPLAPERAETAPAGPAGGGPGEEAGFDAPSLDGVRVLVVDDEEDTRELLRALLARCGAEVALAASAAEALDGLEAFGPDVLVSDIGMPGEDGYALLRRVRALPPERGGRTPAVALTAYARTEDRMRALSAGYQMHVSKPVEPAELAAVIASLVG